jgi:hypothetical protein
MGRCPSARYHCGRRKRSDVPSPGSGREVWDAGLERNLADRGQTPISKPGLEGALQDAATAVVVLKCGMWDSRGT